MINSIARLTSYLLPREWKGHLQAIRAMNLLHVRDLVYAGMLIVLSLFFEAFSITMVLPLFEYIESNRQIEVLTQKAAMWRVMQDVSNFLHVPISLLNLCIVIVILITLRQITNYVSVLNLAEIKQRVGRELSARLFGAILSAKPDYLQDMEAGKFVNLIDVQSQAAASLIRSYASLAQYVITFLIYASVMFVTAPLASLIALVFTGLIIASLNRYVKVGRQLSRDTLLHRQNFSAYISERFQGWRTIKLYGALPREELSFRKWAQDFYVLSVDMFRISGRLQVIIAPVMSLFALGVLYVAVEYVGLSVSQISLFILILLRLVPVAQNFASQRQVIATNGTGLQHVVEVLRQARNAKEVDGGGREFQSIKDGVEFRSVSFSYPGRAEAVLKNISLFIPAGKLTAIIGPSGAGKSTLMDLLSRFGRPVSGEILADGVPLADFSTASLRKKIAYASQSPFIFNDSAYENVRFARPGAERTQVEEACRKAYAHEFIITMPQGYETVLGEGGVKLSGGQRQRLALARAFLAGPNILILDEPTSSLDYESERKIQLAIGEMAYGGGVTVVIVAHRISTVSNADHLIVLDKGHVIDQGTPDEVRARGNWSKYTGDLDAMAASKVAADPTAPNNC